MPSDVSTLPESVSFFPYIDAYVFPDQYITSPYAILCNVLQSKNDGKNGFRDVYNASRLVDADELLVDTLKNAAADDIKAMLKAGVYYYYGISGGKDERKAAYWLKKVSVMGGEYAPIADKLIARMYYAGNMPREAQSYEKSYEYHVKSAKEDLYSASQIGFMRSIGSSCEYSYKQTEDYFLSILHRLDNPRKDTLCKFYIDHGEYHKAADIYKDIVEEYPNAAYQLGLMYKRGVLSNPFMPDYSKAAVYFQKALDNGYIGAAVELGALYFNPTGAFKKDFVKAQKYFELAAGNGDINAQYMLGYMYYYGHVEKNISLAIEYFELAAKQGHVLSASNLGLLYQIPDIHNYEKAFNYSKYAADCGDTVAEFVLGNMYLFERGCEPDADKAYLCFKHAAENGAPEAFLMVTEMDELGI